MSPSVGPLRLDALACAARRALRTVTMVTLASAAFWVPRAGQAQPAPAEAEAAPPRSFGFTAGVGFEASAVDVRGRAVGNGIETVVRVLPDLTMFSRGGRVQGTLVYGGSLAARRGIDDREETTYTNTLSASYLFEAIEGVGFVDARASISQQSISVVGEPAGTFATDRNRTEVTTVSISPYLRGSLAGAAEYELRAAGTVTEADDPAAADSKGALASFTLRSPRRATLVGWGFSGSRQKVKFSGASGATTTDRVGAELVLNPDIDWRLSATAGQERTDVIGAVRQTYENYGVGIQWTPSPRTLVAVRGEERYFGRAHSVAVEYRMPRSVLRYLDSRDVTGGADGLTPGQPVTIYDLLFSQLATQYPDPLQRDQAVRALLQLLGRSPDERVSGGLFGTAGISTVRRRDLSWTWLGPRVSFSVGGYSSDTERVDAAGVNPAGPNDNASSKGYTASIGHRLTPLTSVSLSGARTMSRDSITATSSDFKSASVGLTSRLGMRTTGSLLARYSVLNGTADSRRETALSASLSLRF